MKLLRTRLDRVSFAVIIAIAVAVIVATFNDDDHRSLVNSGDFPGFYAMAELYLRGDPAEVYDHRRQAEIENRIWPWFEGDYYFGAYPPYVPILAAPLAYFDGVVAARIWVIFSVVFFVASLVLMRSLSRITRRNFLPVLAGMLLFTPTFIGVFGGQNTALSMLFVASSAFLLWRSLRYSSTIIEYLAGVPLGFWMVKPQYGGLALLFLALAGYWRIALGGAATFFLLFVMAVPDYGILWPLNWLEVIGKFSTLNYQANFHAQISLVGVMSALAQRLPEYALVLQSVGAVAAGAFALWILSELRRARTARGSAGLQKRRLDTFFLVVAAIPLLSPQALFYDLGITALCALRFLPGAGKLNICRVVLFQLLAFTVIYNRDEFPFPGGIALNIALFTLILFAYRRAPVPPLYD